MALSHHLVPAHVAQVRFLSTCLIITLFFPCHRFSSFLVLSPLTFLPCCLVPSQAFPQNTTHHITSPYLALPCLTFPALTVRPFVRIIRPTGETAPTTLEIGLEDEPKSYRFYFAPESRAETTSLAAQRLNMTNKVPLHQLFCGLAFAALTTSRSIPTRASWSRLTCYLTSGLYDSS